MKGGGRQIIIGRKSAEKQEELNAHKHNLFKNNSVNIVKQNNKKVISVQHNNNKNVNQFLSHKRKNSEEGKKKGFKIQYSNNNVDDENKRISQMNKMLEEDDKSDSKVKKVVKVVLF